MKCFSKNSNLCDHDTSTSRTDGKTDGKTDRQLAVAIAEIAYKRCHLKTVHCTVEMHIMMN